MRKFIKNKTDLNHFMALSSSSSNEKSMLLIDNNNKKMSFSEIRTHEKNAKNPGLLTAPLNLGRKLRERKKWSIFFSSSFPLPFCSFFTSSSWLSRSFHEAKCSDQGSTIECRWVQWIEDNFPSAFMLKVHKSAL